MSDDALNASIAVVESGSSTEEEESTHTRGSFAGRTARLAPLAVVAIGACALLAGAVVQGSISSGRTGAGFAIEEGLVSFAQVQTSGRYIRWKEHPDKCVDVWGEHAGAALQLWTCNDFHGAAVKMEAEFKWNLPHLNEPGYIVWAGNSSYCLNAPYGETEVQLWYCDTAPVQQAHWKITDDGRIHLAYHFTKCLDIPIGEKDLATDGTKLALLDCNGNAEQEGNVIFDIYQQHCAWSQWSEWTACSQTCGGGMRYQARRQRREAVNGGRACAGQSTRSESCSLSKCGT